MHPTASTVRCTLSLHLIVTQPVQPLQVHYNSRVASVTVPKASGEQLTVHMDAHDGAPGHTWAPKLLVAADGARSVVSRALQEAFPGEGHENVQVPSDSGGLGFKVRATGRAALISIFVLTIPPHPLPLS